MHEVSICQSIIDLVEGEFPESALEKVSVVHLKIGLLSCVQPEFLEKVYEFMVSETDLKNSKLEFERIEVTAECESCDCSFQVRDFVFICPQCGTPSSNISHGNELLVDKILFEEYYYEETF